MSREFRCEVHVGDGDRWAIYTPCGQTPVADVISSDIRGQDYVACRRHAEEADGNGQRVDWYDEPAQAVNRVS